MFHPIEVDGCERSWADLLGRRGRFLEPTTQLPEVLSYENLPNGRSRWVERWSYSLSRLQWHDLGPILRAHFVIAVWEGNGSLQRPHVAPLVLPHGSYFLMRLPMTSWHSSLVVHNFAPDLVWPDDRAWCLGGWLELSSTYVGGSVELADAIRMSGLLESSPAMADDALVLV